MKKITLITISIFITAFSYGQCVPNTNYTSQGIYPDTVDNLPKATVGLAYSEDITVVTPADTNFTCTTIYLISQRRYRFNSFNCRYRFAFRF